MFFPGTHLPLPFLKVFVNCPRVPFLHCFPPGLATFGMPVYVSHFCLLWRLIYQLYED